jgi:hypothetical protein
LWMEPPPHAWRLQSVAEAECRRAAAAAEQAYRDAFREEGVAPEEGALAEEHQVRRGGHVHCQQCTGTVYTCRWVGRAPAFPSHNYSHITHNMPENGKLFGGLQIQACVLQHTTRCLLGAVLLRLALTGQMHCHPLSPPATCSAA